MILLLILICIIYPECEANQPWIYPFPGFPSVFKETGKLCVPEELKGVPAQDGEPVYLNLYQYKKGIYHTGVQVYGFEYSYNRIKNVTGNAIKKITAEEVPTRPGRFKFLTSIELGYTNLTQEEVERSVTTLRNEGFTRDKYNLYTQKSTIATTLIGLQNLASLKTWLVNLASVKYMKIENPATSPVCRK